MSYLPITSCILFLIVFTRLGYTLYRLDNTIIRYNTDIKIVKSLMLVPDSTNYLRPIVPPDAEVKTNDKKNKHSTISPIKEEKTDPIQITTVDTNKTARNEAPTYINFEGQYNREVVINRSYKFTHISLSLLYKFVSDSNFDAEYPKGASLFVTEINRIPRLITEELKFKSAAIQQGGPNEIVCVFKEASNPYGLSETNPLSNEIPRTIIFSGTIHNNRIVGEISWEDLSDDMVSFYILKVPITLTINPK